MARRPRIVTPNLPHHIVLRGNNRRRLFSTTGDYHLFHYFLADALRRHGCALHALTLMSHHVQMLLTPREPTSLSSCVKAFAQRYAQVRNDKRGASGRLFEPAFFSCPVLTEAQVAIVTAHIHANPVRAGCVGDALDYQWSTHGLHMCAPARSGIHVELWTPSRWYLSLADDWPGRGRGYFESYEDYRIRGIEPEHVDELEILEMISEQGETWLRRPDGMRASEPAVNAPKNGNGYRYLKG